MLNKRADEEVSSGTIVVSILVILGIAVIVFFIINFSEGGRKQTEAQLGTIASNISDTLECRLWASGAAVEDFDCTKTQCSTFMLCQACKHYGEEYSPAFKRFMNHVDTLGCKPSDATTFTCDDSCKS
jgi:hypothetical protein